MKRPLVLVLIFAAGFGLNAAVTHHPAPAIPPALYETEAYFSPNGGIGARIIKAIDESMVSIDLAIFNLTSRDIKLSLEKAKNRGVKIRIIADGSQAEDPNSVIEALLREGFDIKIIHSQDKGIMHNKFAIFDGKGLFTGSYNWTYSAEHFNYENAILITDPNIVRQYQREFNRILGTAPV